MDFIQNLYNKAKILNKTIVLPESEDTRVLKASELLSKSKLAEIILVGNLDKINQKAKQIGVDISNIQILDPANYDKKDILIQKFIDNKTKKKLEPEEAKKLALEDPVFFGSLLVNAGLADGIVSGAVHATSHTIHCALSGIGIDSNVNLISSFFIMLTPHPEFGINGLMFFADCGVIPYPNAEQLSKIAISTAESFRKLVARTPRIAMLSFSTKGSAKNANIEKVVLATDMVKKQKPDLLIDGELQVDAALIPDVSKRKAPDSPISGRANILIFPDLGAGNIGYKLVQRIGKALALGPIFQGTSKPINDLSRGCSVDDIVNVVAITAAQAQ